MNIFKFWVNHICDDSGKLIDVTNLFECDFVVRSDALKKIEINVDDLPIRLNFDEHKFDCKIFAISEKIKNNVVMEKIYQNNILKISIKCIGNLLDKKAYFDFVVPQIDELKIKSINGDVFLKNVCAEIIEIQSEYGDIQIVESDFLICISNTKGSDIIIDLVKNDYFLKINTNHGDAIINNIYSNPDSPKKIICNSNDGDIIVGVSRNDM